MKKYTREQYLQMIPQSAVKQCFIDAPGYNAAWDCVSVSPDGKRVAIGVRDNLGCVYEFEI